MRLLRLSALTVLLLVATGKASDSTDTAAKAVDTTATATMEENSMPADSLLTSTPSGLKWADLTVGTGKEAVNGSPVVSHYTLWFADEHGKKGERFQSSKDPNPRTGTAEPFPFTVGDSRLIKGWNEGMIGMKEGGTRLLVIPPEIGYGKGGGPIPANTTLIFEIELLEVK